MKRYCFLLLVFFLICLKNTQGQTVIYNIPFTQLVNMNPFDPFSDFCFTGEIKQNAGVTWGMDWNSTNPQTPSSISVEMVYTFESGNGPYNVTLNGSSVIPTFNPSALAGCSFSVQTYTFNPSSYNPNGINQLRFDYSPGGARHFMWTNLVWGGLYYARVIVNYSCVAPMGTDIQVVCDSLTWTDGNTYTSNNTTATDTIVTGMGCDSVVTLNLTVKNSSTYIDTRMACDSLTWIDGNTYTSNNNSATHVLTSAQGCDSTITLNLTVNNTTNSIDTHVVCHSLTWIDGNTYNTNNNTASHVIVNAQGCDSIITLNLTVNATDDPSFGYPSSTYCLTGVNPLPTITGTGGGVFNGSPGLVIDTFSGLIDLMGSGIGTYNITYLTQGSCPDSSSVIINITNAPQAGFSYPGSPYCNTGSASVSYQPGASAGSFSSTPSGLVLNSSTGEVNLSSSNPGLYSVTNTILAAGGCASTSHDTTINILPLDDASFSYPFSSYCINQSDPIPNVTGLIGGMFSSGSGLTISTLTGTIDLSNSDPGNYPINYLTNGTCPNNSTFNISIHDSSSYTDTKVVCDSLTWIDGNTYTSDNHSATHLLTNHFGCDSLVKLDLNVNYSSFATDILVACDSLTWIDGNTYSTNNNSAIHILPNAVGCDSIVTLNLTINASSNGIDNRIACDSIIWINGNMYTSSTNTATHVLINHIGCDSLVQLDLTINNSSSNVDVQTACDNYTWIDGNTYTSSNNTATFTLPNASGCDSLITLDLTINNSSISIDSIVACNSYTWIDGNTYTSSNSVATHSLSSTSGCDSTVSLNLLINYTSTVIDTQTACDAYTWIDGSTYTSNNNSATRTLVSSTGCDSIVTLDLTINHSTITIDTQTACNSFTWIDGNTYTTSSNNATHTLTNSSGCDSLVKLHLTINKSSSGTDTQMACDSLIWIDGNTYISNNNNATHTTTNVSGCDSLITLDLTVVNIDTSVTLTGHTISSNEIGSNYQWIDCIGDSLIDGETNTSFTATFNGMFAVEINKNGCLDTSTCIIINSVGINENVFDNKLLLYPNPSQGEFYIQITNRQQQVSVQVFDILNRSILKKSFNQNEKIYVDLRNKAIGTYFIEIVSEQRKTILQVVKN